MPPLIEFRGIEKSFGAKKVLDGLSLKVDRGETITILGGSGSGKTVLLKILLRLMLPERGHVLFDGRDVVAMERDELLRMRRRLGMLFQGGALFDSLSVRENVAYPLREHFHYTEGELDRIVARKLEVVGLSGSESMAPGDLSGGMKKRVALARAIATDPEVILYDEPTTGLDPVNCRRINQLIRRLQTRLKVTSIVVTHDIDSAFAISDRLALLHGGKIGFEGTRSEMTGSSDPVVRRFLGGEREETDVGS